MTDELIGTQLGQYRLTESIRRGGMATVYKGYQASLDRYVAIKVLFFNRDPNFAARFKREARAIAQLQHPNILPIYDYGEQDGMLYLALQYVENGATLTDLMGAPMAPVTALRLTSQLLNALDYAHQRSVIHRDIKPANVLMPSPRWPMLADFGIAMLLNDTSQRLTVPGLIVGTAAYMAPEQAEGRPVDARTDLYATGVVLYEMVTGRVPFEADTPIGVLTKHVYEAPPPPRRVNPDIPVAVETLLLRALAKDAAARYQTAAEMSADLERVASRIEQSGTQSQLTGLYHGGVQAFEEGRWDQAVDQFSKLVTLDAGYEDASDMLEAAREAQERTKQEARQQMEALRQRRQSTIQQQLPASAQPVATSSGETIVQKSSRETSRFTQIADSPVGTAPSASTSALAATPAAAPSPSESVAAIAPAQPAPAAQRSRLPLVIGGVVVLLLLALGVSRVAGLWPTSQVTPQANPTAANASVPTTSTSGVGDVATAEPATAATAAPSSTETQPVQQAGPPPPDPIGALIYEDDFSAGGAKSGLEDLPKATDFQRGFHSPGVYHFRILQPNDTRWEILPRHTYRDFSLQIELIDNSDKFTGDVAQGMIFRVRDTEHFYALLIDPRKGQYNVRKLDGKDQWSDLIAWTPSPLIKQGADTNLLRIDAVGNAFTLYLNGAGLANFKDDTYSSGMLGMMVANVDAEQPHMHFDNIKIWSADAAIDPGLPQARTDPHGDMVLIPGGEFILGSNEKRDEPPQIVALPNFYIDRSEVTNAAYTQCVAEGKCTAPGSPASETHPNYATETQFADFPVIQVSWQQAQTFCGWAGKRLPTEAEWEKAASWNAATYQKSVWPWGDVFDPKQLNSSEANIGDTSTVGQFPPELNGTVDMGGNVSEWTSTLYMPYPYSESDGREDAQAGGDRVFRGGSWAQSEGKARSFFRQPAAPTYIDREIGFRCAVTP
jgi:serine/threonine protein kinase/formylglycine-generating enzyme required for sulfatase activity